MNVSYNVTKNVSKVDFTVTSKDGKAEQTYTLYIIRSNTGEKEVYVNGTKLTKTSGGYTYEVPYGATAADIKVVADSEVSKVQIGDSEFKVSENAETVTLDSGKTTTVTFKIYSYPYDDNSFIAETITLVRQDQSLALSNVMVQSKSERDYTKLTPDKYGNYKTAIPSTDDSASIVIATRRSDSKLGLIRVTDTGDVVLGEDQGQLSVPDIANLGTVNKFYIVVSDGTKTSRYELVIVKYSNNTSVEKVIAERGTEDEYVAKDASCGGGSTILPEDPDGSKASPYQITTAEELQAMSDHLDAYYVLMNDIDLSGTAWTPVGTTAEPFTGNLNGNGKSISNLTITATSNDTAYGLFGVNKGEVYDFKLEDVNITSVAGTSYQYIGAVAGRNEQNGVISRVAVASGNIESSYAAGGVAGGCRAAVESGRIDAMRIFTYDCVPSTKKLLDDGIITATICQQPYKQGYLPVELLSRYLIEGISCEEFHYTDIDIRIKENL